MAYPSYAELRRAERTFRRYDKALRLRRALETPAILVERKTFVGRVGAVMFGGEDYIPDSGVRRELGHVHVASVPVHLFEPVALLDSLKASDTWKQRPLWQRVQEADDIRDRDTKRSREDMTRYKASNLFDNYVWRYRQRVNVPVQVA